MTDQTSNTRAFFDGLAGRWSGHYAEHGSMADRTGRFVASVGALAPAGARVLDLGCGTGQIALALAAAGFQVSAADISSTMLETAGLAAGADRIDWHRLEAGPPTTSLPFADRSFAAVICSSVLEYVEPMAWQLGEIARVLQPGGSLHATVPDLRHPVRRGERLKRRLARFRPTYLLAQHTRWRHEFSYLRLSINWWPLERWQDRLIVAGLIAAPVGPSIHPLYLLVARKPDLAGS